MLLKMWKVKNPVQNNSSPTKIKFYNLEKIKPYNIYIKTKKQLV